MTAQTCFHGRHIQPMILKGLDGDNWRLKGYEDRGGYRALRKVFADKLTPDAVIADFEQWVKIGAPDPREGKAAVVAQTSKKWDPEAAKKWWPFSRCDNRLRRR